MLHLVQAGTEEDYDRARTLFQEYADWLGFHLCFQNFDQELQALAEQYGPPTGALILAYDDRQLIGCVGVRQWDTSESTAELKRMYIREAYRGLGLGRRLLHAAIASARKLSYHRIVLDTLPRMEAAIALYREAGFKPIPPYYHNPFENVIYLELRW